MSEKYRVHELVKFRYSDIGEYIDEDHTDRPLRNDILVELLNKQDESINELKYSNHNRAKIIIQLTDKINQLEEENNKLRQDNDLDTIFGISDEELTKKFESAINRDKEICKSKGLPIARYDNENKCAYLEYPDGKKEYIQD